MSFVMWPSELTNLLTNPVPKVGFTAFLMETEDGPCRLVSLVGFMDVFSERGRMISISERIRSNEIEDADELLQLEIS